MSYTTDIQEIKEVTLVCEPKIIVSIYIEVMFSVGSQGREESVLLQVCGLNPEYIYTHQEYGSRPISY